MYSKIDEGIEKSIRNNGKIEFIPDAENYKHATFMNYVKHNITYIYYLNGTEELGWFYLSMGKEKRYLMGSFNFTKEYRSGLKTFFLDIIIEKAILEAEKLFVDRLVVVSMEKLLVESFLNYRFKVEPIGDPTLDGKVTYKGTKHFKQIIA